MSEENRKRRRMRKSLCSRLALSRRGPNTATERRGYNCAAIDLREELGCERTQCVDTAKARFSRNSGAHRGDRGLRNLGTDSRLLEVAQSCSGYGDSRSPVRLDELVFNPITQLATPLERGEGKCAVSSRCPLLPGERINSFNQLVLIYLGGEYRPRN